MFFLHSWCLATKPSWPQHYLMLNGTTVAPSCSFWVALRDQIAAFQSTSWWGCLFCSRSLPSCSFMFLDELRTIWTLLNVSECCCCSLFVAHSLSECNPCCIYDHQGPDFHVFILTNLCSWICQKFDQNMLLKISEKVEKNSVFYIILHINHWKFYFVNCESPPLWFQ